MIDCRAQRRTESLPPAAVHLEGEERLKQLMQGNLPEGSKRILALGQQMGQAFLWSPLDLATANAETTVAWWKSSVTFPEEYTYEDKA